jgi:hypothetical protein
MSESSRLIQETSMGRIGWQGTMLIAGGVLTFVANILTPLLNADAAFAERASSSLFLWRQGLSAMAAFCLLVGAVSVMQSSGRRAGFAGMTALALAIVGSALLFAHEWSQVAVIQPLARVAPAALTALEDTPGLDAFDISAMLAITTFSLGWLSAAVVMIRARLVPRPFPLILIAGFFCVPLLSGALGPVAGTVIGSTVLAAGWVLTGYGLRSPAVP